MKPQETDICTYFPVVNQCTEPQRTHITQSSDFKFFKAQEAIFHNSKACSGLIAVVSGQLRAFIESSEGKQVSLYHLFPYDVCIMTASCLLRNVSFDIQLVAQTDTLVLLIPTQTIEQINAESAIFKSFTLDIMTQRFSDVMWVIEQMVFSSMSARIATYLVESSLQHNHAALSITHEQIAQELGSAREVITRILKYFQTEGWISMQRSKIKVIKPLELAFFAKD